MSSDPLLTPSLPPSAEAPLHDAPDAPEAVGDAPVAQGAAADSAVTVSALAEAAAGPVATDDAPTTGAATVADEKTPSDAAPAACGPQLKALFPGLFGGAPKPLKLRIQVDIQARAPGVFTRKMLSAFLHRYTGSHVYLMAMARGSQRFDLDGQACADLTPEHRAAAATELARRRGHQDERRALEDQQRRNRAGLLRDFETTTLTPANFCALKGVAEAELEGLLARARAEAAERPLPPPHRTHAARAQADSSPMAAPATQRRPLPMPQRQRPGAKREAR